MIQTRREEFTATGATHRLFFVPSPGSIVKIVNVNNDTTAGVVSVEIIGVGDADDTTLSLSLLHRKDMEANKDVSWQDLEGIEFDGTKRIRATFQSCVAGDLLTLTVGID